MLIKRNENISARDSVLRVFKKNNVEFEAIEPRNGEIVHYVEIINDDGGPLRLYGKPNELLYNSEDYHYVKIEEQKIECIAMLKSVTDDMVNELSTYVLDKQQIGLRSNFPECCSNFIYRDIDTNNPEAAAA